MKISLEKADLEYFDRGKIENPRFWSRLGKEPSFKELKVLDVGCGHGSLCVDVASKGAKKVIGIDMNEQLINFAKENVLHNYLQFKNILDFQCCNISDLPEVNFDIILSKASFEHILNLDLVLAEMKKRLKTGGKIYIGFGPLYNSPYGDHKRTKALLPWGHLIFPESFLLKRLNKHRQGQEKIISIYELGLNKLSLTEYKKLFYKSGLRVSYFQVNMCNSLNVGYYLIGKLFSLINKIPFLEEFFTFNISCILEKKIIE